MSKWVGTTHPNSSHMSWLEGQAYLALELQSYLWSKTGFPFLTLVCSVAQEIYAHAKVSNARQFRSPFPGQGAATTLTFFSIEPYFSPAMNNFFPSTHDSLFSLLPLRLAPQGQNPYPVALFSHDCLGTVHIGGDL